MPDEHARVVATRFVREAAVVPTRLHMEAGSSPRQRQVLEALTRLGEATIPDLRGHLPGLAPSEIYRVLQALMRKNLVSSSGNSSQVYLGGVLFWPRGRARGIDEQLEVIDAELREAGVPFDHWVDLDGRRVVVLIPVAQWIWGLVAYDTGELHSLRDAIIALRASDEIDSVRMDTRLTSDSDQQEAFAIELLPPLED